MPPRSNRSDVEGLSKSQKDAHPFSQSFQSRCHHRSAVMLLKGPHRRKRTHPVLLNPRFHILQNTIWREPVTRNLSMIKNQYNWDWRVSIATGMDIQTHVACCGINSLTRVPMELRFWSPVPIPKKAVNSLEPWSFFHIFSLYIPPVMWKNCTKITESTMSLSKSKFNSMLTPKDRLYHPITCVDQITSIEASIIHEVDSHDCFLNSHAHLTIVHTFASWLMRATPCPGLCQCPIVLVANTQHIPIASPSWHMISHWL
jgi:hypothetical protein